MKKEENIIGTIQGIFKVLYECDFKSNDGHRMFHVRCIKCGWETNIQKHQIKYTKKCNHLTINKEYVADHVWSSARLRQIYDCMYYRCYNKKDKAYRFYGEKGIKICEQWLHNSKKFEEWALNNGYKEDLTIDRIDSSKGYSPENCRWISSSNNSKYKSTTNIIEVNNEKHTGREWAKILQVSTNTINLLLRKHPEEKVKKFIELRLIDKNKNNHRPKNGQSWFSVYGIEK